MKITITGSLGNISKPLAKQLIGKGNKVTIVSSNTDKVAQIEELGATAAIGSVTDVAFLVKAFTGADVVYTMVPPNFGASNLDEYITGIGQNYAKAIEQAGVQGVVNLSSMGAHLANGPTPILAAQKVENTLNKLQNVSVKHLRPPFFYVNYYGLIGMIKNMGILGSNYPGSTKLILVHPEDIADAAADAIKEGFTGKSFRYVASDERTAVEVATILGAAIGKPELQWVEFSDEQALNGILQAGVPEEIAKSFVETGTFLRSGKLWEDYNVNSDAYLGCRKLEAFAREFAAKFISE